MYTTVSTMGRRLPSCTGGITSGLRGACSLRTLAVVSPCPRRPLLLHARAQHARHRSVVLRRVGHPELKMMLKSPNGCRGGGTSSGGGSHRSRSRRALHSHDALLQQASGAGGKSGAKVAAPPPPPPPPSWPPPRGREAGSHTGSVGSATGGRLAPKQPLPTVGDGWLGIAGLEGVCCPPPASEFRLRHCRHHGLAP